MMCFAHAKEPFQQKQHNKINTAKPKSNQSINQFSVHQTNNDKIIKNTGLSTGRKDMHKSNPISIPSAGMMW